MTKPAIHTIFKITTADLWLKAQNEGVLPPSPVDVADGYMHFSTREQLGETLRLHFEGQARLVVLAVPVSAIDKDLRWEPSRGGQLFPHLYAPLEISAIARVHEGVSVSIGVVNNLPELQG